MRPSAPAWAEASLTSSPSPSKLTAVVRTFILAALSASFLAAQTTATNPFEGSPPDIDVGRATFRIYCSPCHGIDASGGRGPDLTTGVYNAGDRDGDLFEVVADGVPGTEMPGYGARMADEAIWRIVAYVRSVALAAPPPAIGNAERGREIYHGAGGCVGCHQIDGRGGRLGPDLSRVGRARSPKHLRRSLEQPGAELTSGYQTVEVVTAGGDQVSGIAKSFDNFHVVLIDSGEKLRVFDRAELRSSERVFRSLMPAYGDSLTEDNLDDLVAYLAQLGREETAP